MIIFAVPMNVSNPLLIVIIRADNRESLQYVAMRSGRENGYDDR